MEEERLKEIVKNVREMQKRMKRGSEAIHEEELQAEQEEATPEQE